MKWSFTKKCKQRGKDGMDNNQGEMSVPRKLILLQLKLYWSTKERKEYVLRFWDIKS
jgi:hypothetical protein